MADFHVGDKVQIVSPNARVERVASFEITELKDFDGELCATGEGHAWWPVEMLDYDLTEEQKAVREDLERAYHEAGVALHRCVAAEKKAATMLPGRMIKAIRDCAQLEVDLSFNRVSASTQIPGVTGNES